MIVKLILIAMSVDLSGTSRSSPPVVNAKPESTKLSVKCEFSVHKDGPNGEPVTGTALDVVLYYSIRCNPQDGYCLSVGNCTVSADEIGFKPYLIIDDNGCSLEPSLYDDVTYESSFNAGIRNPYPVRFRSSSGAVLLYCVTTIIPTSRDGICERHKCGKAPPSS